MLLNTPLKVVLILFILWSNANKSIGQDFKENSSAIGISHSFEAKALMGGGAAFFDFDNDGYDDLYLTNGIRKDAIYHNNQDGTFSEIQQDIGFGITIRFNTTAVTTGDLDNDGDKDVFVTTWEEYVGGNEPLGRNLLFRNNNDGTFTEVGLNAGLSEAAFSIGANFFDYDNDGFLDIAVINHLEAPAFLYDSSGVVIGFDHDCFSDLFYRNNGDFTFTEISQSVGITNMGCALASAPSDFDLDGDLDFFVANDFGPFIEPNKLYRNNHPDNSFTEIGGQVGAGIPMYGMGIAIGDYDNDLDLDYYITNLGRNVLLENNNGIFQDVTTTADVENTYANSSEFATGWGTAFLDIDNDSWLDLYVANGRIPSLPTLPTAPSDPNKLYMNSGDRTFLDVSEAAEVDDSHYCRGMAYSDFDRDGDLDLFVVALVEDGGVSNFYVNNLDNSNHYVQFRLIGKESNRDGIGAKVWVHVNGKTYLSEYNGGQGSFCSQSTSTVHFGLKDESFIDSVKVGWPSGRINVWRNMRADSLYYLEENLLSTSVGEKESDEEISIGPNPFTHRIFIQTKNAQEEEFLLRFSSMEGRLLLERKCFISKAGYELDLSSLNLARSIYMVELKGENMHYSKKLIYNR